MRRPWPPHEALDIDPTKLNMSNIGRPMPIADKSAKPIAELLRG